MTRLRNSLTGAVVSCDKETAARLGGEWVPVEAPKPTAKPKRARKS